MHRAPRLLRTPKPFAWLALMCLAATADAAGSITGVCPDGSFFIVKTEASIPCRDAKLVAPEDLPPIRPQYLPRPYAWEEFHRRNDPNNPYNLVDGEPDASGNAAGTAREAEPPPEALPAVESPPRAAEAAARSTGTPTLALSDQELHDLHLIVELSQTRAPATFDGPDGVTLRLAHSESFEPRVHQAYGEGGPVVLFAAGSDASGSEFHPNLTFVQGHRAFHPDPTDERQIALIDGAAGPLAAGDEVLGYVVLPEGVDLGEPIDVYWDDRRISVTLRR